jgi:ribosomal protein L22
MNSLLDEAMNKIKILPESEQERIALLIMEEISNGENNNNIDDFDLIIQDCQINTGISDLSYQHDHYLYGKPKQILE